MNNLSCRELADKRDELWEVDITNLSHKESELRRETMEEIMAVLFEKREEIKRII